MSDTVNFAIVGCGRISQLHAKAYNKSRQANLLAVCDIDEDKAAAKAEEWGVDSGMVFTDYDKLLQLEELDAVDLLLPHDLHEKMTQLAARANKHVSVQKPMAMNLDDCQKMIDVCQENEVKLRVLENFRFYPPYIKAKELIDSGVIGRPSFIHIKLGTSLGGGWEVPLDAWMWRFDSDRCGGGPIVWDDGYHKFSIAEYLLGEVSTVKAWIDKTGVFDDDDEPPVIIDSPAAVMWKYKSPRTYGTMDVTYSREGEFHSDYYAADERIEITGDKGYIWINQCTAKALRDEASVVTYIEGELKEYRNIESDWQASFDRGIEQFAESILHGTEPVLTGEKAKYIQRFATAVHVSAERGSEVTLEEL